jgi:predicted GNAT family acetyltransferase
MRVEGDADLRAFARTALPWLLHDPVTNNLTCALILGCLEGTVPTGQEAWGLRAVDDDGELAGLALYTPPGGLLISAMPVPAAETLAAVLADRRGDLCSVTGPGAVVEPFAARYAERADVAPTVGEVQRLHCLNQLSTPQGVGGRLREASTADLDLLARWLTDSVVETMVDTPPAETLDQARAEAAAVVTALLRAGGLAWLWENAGQPVSMAYLSPAIAGVTRVSGVYTPPDQRGHGYASACVAEVSRTAVAQGASTCVLYTDPANLTSNRIYQRIGYRPVSDLQEWCFR